MARVLLSAVPLVQDSAVGLARCFAYICKLGCTPGLLLIAKALGRTVLPRGREWVHV